MSYPPGQKPPQWSIDSGVVAYNANRFGLPMPVGLWAMWEKGGLLVHDLSGCNNLGVGTGITWQISDSGVVLYFNQDKVDCGLNPNLDITSQITLSAWVSGDDLTSVDIIVKSNSAQNAPYHQWQFGTNSGSHLYLAGDNGGTYRSFVEDAGTLTSGWHYVVTTHDGTWSRIYIDGKLVASDNTYSGGFVSHPTWPPYIGFRRYKPAGENSWLGYIDNVILWDVALLPIQVQTLYTNSYGLIVDPYQIETLGFVAAGETINLAGILPAMSGSMVRKLMPKRQLAGSI